MTFFKPAQPVYLVGPSAYLPDRVVTNDDLLSWMGTEARSSWITHRTGIRERRWAAENQACSDLAVEAARRLFSEEGISSGRITQLLLATISGDHPSPPTAPLLLPRLGLEGIGAMDVGAACAGFVSGIHLASALSLATRGDQLLIASEIRSRFLSPKDFSTAALFGDGAAACLVTTRPEGASFRLVATQLGGDGALADIVGIRAGGSRLPHHLCEDEASRFIQMRSGSELFGKAVALLTESARALLSRSGQSADEIHWVVPHQANLRILHAFADELAIPRSKLVETVPFTGNTSGASVGIALHHLRSKIGPKPGERVLLVSAGAGGASACALVEAITPG